jgi:hypothetical protein
MFRQPAQIFQSFQPLLQEVVPPATGDFRHVSSALLNEDNVVLWPAVSDGSLDTQTSTDPFVGQGFAVPEPLTTIPPVNHGLDITMPGTILPSTVSALVEPCLVNADILANNAVSEGNPVLAATAKKWAIEIPNPQICAT